MRITLDGLPPSKKNSKRVFKAGKKTVVLPSVKHEQWHNMNMLKLSGNIKPISHKNVGIVFSRASKIRRDLDNMASSVLDLLVDAGVLEDDSMDYVESLRLSWKWASAEQTEIIIS